MCVDVWRGHLLLFGLRTHSFRWVELGGRLRVLDSAIEKLKLPLLSCPSFPPSTSPCSRLSSQPFWALSKVKGQVSSCALLWGFKSSFCCERCVSNLQALLRHVSKSFTMFNYEHVGQSGWLASSGKQHGMMNPVSLKMCKAVDKCVTFVSFNKTPGFIWLKNAPARTNRSQRCSQSSRTGILTFVSLNQFSDQITSQILGGCHILVDFKPDCNENSL